jgi:tetratricopeptide (TPR) repeat protein
LLYEFRQGRDRAFVLSGSCSPDGQQTPFLPFIEVVRGAFRLSAGEEQKDVAQKLEMGLTALSLYSARNVGLLLHLFSLEVPDDALKGLDGVLIGLRTRELLQQLLEARCRLSPVVLLIEDLHWIDSVSEELLNKLVGGEVKLRLLILTTRRPEYSPSWLNSSVVITLPLEPLPTGDIRHLIRERLGVDTLPEELARQVTEKADGNPLFAEEILSYFTERGILRIVESALEFDASAVASALPASVQSLLAARVDRLAPKDRALLQAASVVGRRFDPQLLTVALNQTDVDNRLAAMQALDLVYVEGKSSDYMFKHALVRDALYQSLLTEPRKSLHLKIAEEIERRSSNRLTEVVEVLAHHYSQTDRADKAFSYLSMAGSKSLNVYSVDEASTHLNAALALLDENPGCASDDQVADFLIFVTLLLNLKLEVSVMIAVLERYLARADRLKEDPRVVLIRHHYVFALVWNARYREAVVTQRETSAIADRLGDARSMAYSLAGEILVSTVFAPLPLDEFEAIKRKAIRAASETPDAHIQNWTRFVIGWEEFHRGRMKKAREAAGKLMEVGKLLNDPRSTGLGLALLGWIAVVSDSYAEGIGYCEQSLAVAITPFDRACALDCKECALVLLRRTEEAVQLLEEHRRRCAANGDLYTLVVNEGISGLCKIFQGNIGGGIRLIDQAIRRREREGLRGYADWLRFNLAEVYLQIIMGNEKLPILTLIGNLPTLLIVMVTATQRIRSLTTHGLANPRYDPAGHAVGRALMILGLLYKIKKKRALAVQHLTEAKRIFSQFGQTPILARVETALAELAQ